MAKSRGWCFTINNPETHEISWTDKVQYAVWQEEKGEETGTPHLQGYMEFKIAQAFSAIKKLLPTAHIEPRKGTPEQARAYAMKAETRVKGPWEYGTWCKQQGKRTDLESVADRIKEGATMRQIAEEHPTTYIKFHKGLNALKSAMSTPRTWKTNVIVRWGEPGSGKTRWVYDTYNPEEVFVKPPGDWYDGYDGHKVVLIDDFYGDIKYTELLRILDRYQMTVPIKGGFVNWAPETIIITSNAPPEEWYKNIKDKRALLRRIEQVVKCGASDYEGHEKFSCDMSISSTDLLEPRHDAGEQSTSYSSQGSLLSLSCSSRTWSADSLPEPSAYPRRYCGRKAQGQAALAFQEEEVYATART